MDRWPYSFVLVFLMGHRTIIERYVARLGIAQVCLCEVPRVGFFAHFGGLLTSLKWYRSDSVATSPDMGPLSCAEACCTTTHQTITQESQNPHIKASRRANKKEEKGTSINTPNKTINANRLARTVRALTARTRKAEWHLPLKDPTI